MLIWPFHIVNQTVDSQSTI